MQAGCTAGLFRLGGLVGYCGILWHRAVRMRVVLKKTPRAALGRWWLGGGGATSGEAENSQVYTVRIEGTFGKGGNNWKIASAAAAQYFNHQTIGLIMITSSFSHQLSHCFFMAVTKA